MNPVSTWRSAGLVLATLMFSISGCGDDEADARKSITPPPVDPLPEFEDGDRVGWLIPVAPGTLGDGDMTFSSTNITLECPFFEEPVDMNGVTNLIAFCEDLTLVEIQELINSKISQDISIGTTSGGIDFDEKAIIGIFKAGPANDEGQIEYEFLQVWALDLSLDLEEG